MKIVFKILFAISTLFLISCSRKVNTASTRAFHEITAQYNVYFNGNESFKAGEAKAEAVFPLSFTDLLPVFALSYNEVPNLTASEMERAISKCQKLAEKHSITAKPENVSKRSRTKEERAFYNKKEYNGMVPLAFMMIAKAQAYKHNFAEAAATLDNMSAQYPKEPVMNEARIWRAIVATERGNLTEAESQLRAISHIRNYPKQYHQIYHSAWANLLIKQDKYAEAIARLKKATDITNNRNTKARYNFLLAQLYTKIGDKPNAATFYDKVANMNAPFSVVLAAQLCKANISDEANSDALKSVYLKMLKDKRNNEYKDQIYYALGNLERRRKNGKDAIKYYNLSVQRNAGNNEQLALSYTALADLYFIKPDYIKSYNNYKNAENLITDKNSSYKKISEQIKMMKTLAPNLEIIQREDSLQNIARMPESARNKMIDSLIASAAESKKNEQKLKETQNFFNSQTELQRYGIRSNAATQNASGKWYFYNAAQINNGATEFTMRWGRRKLEDNWRRKNKNIISVSEIAEEPDTNNAEDKEITQEQQLSPTDKMYYLQNVPLTTDEMQKSDKKIAFALNAAASAYKNDMNDDARAIATYEELVLRYPASQYTPEAYYNLYNMYIKTNENAKAETCKNLLASQFPNNVYTLSVVNPDYLNKIRKTEEDAENAYYQILTLNSENKLNEASALANESLIKYKDTKTAPYFELMSIVSGNYENNILKYKEDLKNLAAKYKDTKIETAANNILSTLQNNEADTLFAKAAETNKNIVAKFETESNSWNVILVTENSAAKQTMFDVTVFNSDNFLNNNYSVEIQKFNKKYDFVIIGTLNTRAEADNYRKTLQINSTIKSVALIIANSENLQKIKDNGNISDYLQFYEMTYEK